MGHDFWMYEMLLILFFVHKKCIFAIFCMENIRMDNGIFTVVEKSKLFIRLSCGYKKTWLISTTFFVVPVERKFYWAFLYIKRVALPPNEPLKIVVKKFWRFISLLFVMITVITIIVLVQNIFLFFNAFYLLHFRWTINQLIITN